MVLILISWIFYFVGFKKLSNSNVLVHSRFVVAFSGNMPLCPEEGCWDRMTTEEECVEQMWSCSVLFFWAPAKSWVTTQKPQEPLAVAERHVTLETPETQAKPRGRPQSQERLPSGKMKGGPETSGLPLLRRQSPHLVVSVIDRVKSCGWPSTCEAQHNPPIAQVISNYCPWFFLPPLPHWTCKKQLSELHLLFPLSPLGWAHRHPSLALPPSTESGPTKLGRVRYVAWNRQPRGAWVA